MENISQFVDLLTKADVIPNGVRPWDPQIKDPRVFERVLREGSLGLGEAYMAGWWECKDLAELSCRIARSDIFSLIREITLALPRVAAEEQAPVHYDTGNGHFRAMLGKTMAYTCGYFESGREMLDEAQEKKWDLVCRKIGLEAGQTVLDIGCGWGSFALHAAKYFGARVVGVTDSREQALFAAKHCENAPVDIRFQDYRNVQGVYDHVVSLGMFEHVGPAHYDDYFDVVRRVLKDNGLFLLHTITGNVSADQFDPWLKKYVFPDAHLPSLAQITAACDGKFLVEDTHNIGAHYDRTLLAWWGNLEWAWDAACILPRPDERTRRMWQYYLLTCAGTFRARKNHVHQFVLSPKGVFGGYESIR